MGRQIIEVGSHHPRIEEYNGDAYEKQSSRPQHNVSSFVGYHILTYSTTISWVETNMMLLESKPLRKVEL